VRQLEDHDAYRHELRRSAAAATSAAPAPQSSGKAPAVSNATNLSQKPKIAKPAGSPPSALIKKDLVVGKGPAVKAGQLAVMQYVGISWSNGKEFERVLEPRPAVQLPARSGSGHRGLGQRHPRHEGRRPPRARDPAPTRVTGPQGSPPAIGPNETLVFVVDLKHIG